MVRHSQSRRQPDQRGSAVLIIKCQQCGKKATKRNADISRAKRTGMKLFCDKKCFGLSRRKNRTVKQKKEKKRLYDIEYRAKNLEKITNDKREYFQRTYDPVKAAKERKKNMARHVEYCRQPEYRRKKKTYDRQYLSKKEHGEFWECALLIRDIDSEVATRMTKYEVRQANGLINKKLQRRRDYERTFGPNSEICLMGYAQQGKGR